MSPQNQLFSIFQFFLEIDHANMTDRVILAPIVHALSTKHIVGTLAAVLRRVRTLFICIVVTSISIFSSNSGLRRWKGCTCAKAEKVCGTKKCSCFRAHVECDPEVCLSCGTKYVSLSSFCFAASLHTFVHLTTLIQEVKKLLS